MSEWSEREYKRGEREWKKNKKSSRYIATILLIFASKKWILQDYKKAISLREREKNIKIKKVEKEGDINKFFFRRGAREWYFPLLRSADILIFGAR